MKREFTSVTAAALLGQLLFLGGCAKKEEAEAKPVVEVKTAQAVIEDVEQTITGPATVFAAAQAGVAARSAAPIKRLLVKKGDTVQAGQALAELESRDLVAGQAEAQAGVADAEASLQKTVAGTLPGDVERARGQLVAAEAAYKQADAIYQRRKSLFEEGAIPQRDLLVAETELATDKANYEVAKMSLDLLKNQSRERDIQMARSHVEQAQAHLAGAEAQLSYARITAPFAGTVTEQFMFPGDMARPDAPVFTVSDLSKAVARAQIPESDSGPIHSGQTCAFLPGSAAATGDGGKPAPLAGRITMVNRSADPARRTVEVWCEIGAPPASLHPGSFGDVAVVTARGQGVTVPREALQFNEGTRTGWVMAIEGRTAHRRDVETAEVSGARVRILKGLKGGETVATEGVYSLTDGMQVQLPGDKPAPKEPGASSEGKK